MNVDCISLLTEILQDFMVKFMFSKKATKTDKIFNVNLTFTTWRQIDGEDFFKFRGLLRKHKL